MHRDTGNSTEQWPRCEQLWSQSRMLQSSLMKGGAHWHVPKPSQMPFDSPKPVLPVRRKGTRHARNVDLILVVVRVVIPSLAAVLADLFIRILIHVTEVARTGNIGTVRSIITAVALAETVTTITLIVAVVRAVVHTQAPHVIEHHGWEGVIRGLFLFDAITDPTEHVDLAQGSRIRRPPAQMRHQNSSMVRPLVRPQVLQTRI